MLENKRDPVDELGAVVRMHEVHAYEADQVLRRSDIEQACGVLVGKNDAAPRRNPYGFERSVHDPAISRLGFVPLLLCLLLGRDVFAEDEKAADGLPADIPGADLPSNPVFRASPLDHLFVGPRDRAGQAALMNLLPMRRQLRKNVIMAT